MPECPKCRVAYMVGESHVCGSERKWRQSGSREAQSERTSTPADVANALSRRYLDGYRQARFISGFGQFVKIAGGVIGAVIVVAGLASLRDSTASSTLSTGVAVGSIVGGGVVALVFFVAGVMIAAQGQMLLASLDTAVNSSTILTNDQRTRIMF